MGVEADHVLIVNVVRNPYNPTCNMVGMVYLPRQLSWLERVIHTHKVDGSNLSLGTNIEKSIYRDKILC